MTLYYTTIQVSTSKVPLAYLPPEGGGLRSAGRGSRDVQVWLFRGQLSLLSLKDSLAEGAGEKRQIEKSGQGIVPGKNGRLQRSSQ